MRWRAFSLLPWLALLLGSMTGVTAPLSENQLKAAFLYKFGSYVEWPPEAFANRHSPLVIGVVTDVEVANALQQLIHARRVDERPLRLLRLSEQDDFSGVHILYVPHNADVEFRLARTASEPMLTVTDKPQSELRPYYAIHFMIDSNRLRFDVDLDEARQRRLRVDARLLAIARRVHGAGA